MNNQATVYKNISKNLKNYRLGKSLTQEEFAEMLGLSQSQYSKIENARKGSGMESMSNLIHYANIIGINVQDLLSSDEAEANSISNKVICCPKCSFPQEKVYFSTSDFNKLLKKCDFLLDNNKFQRANAPYYSKIIIELTNEPFMAIFEYSRNNHELHAEILERNDTPWKGCQVFGTIDMKDASLLFKNKDLEKGDAVIKVHPLASRLINDFCIYYRVLNDYLKYKGYTDQQIHEDSGIYIYSNRGEVCDRVVVANEIPNLATVTEDKTIKSLHPSTHSPMSFDIELSYLSDLFEAVDDTEDNFISSLFTFNHVIHRFLPEDRVILGQLIFYYFIAKHEWLEHEKEELPAKTNVYVLLAFLFQYFDYIEFDTDNIALSICDIMQNKQIELTPEQERTVEEYPVIRDAISFVSLVTKDSDDVKLEKTDLVDIIFKGKPDPKLEKVNSLWNDYYNEIKPYYEGLEEASDLDIQCEIRFNLLAADSSTYLIWYKNKLAGFAYIGEKSEHYILEELFVTKEFRRKGVASLTIDQIVKKVSNGRNILIQKTDENDISEKFWSEYISSRNYQLRLKKDREYEQIYLLDVEGADEEIIFEEDRSLEEIVNDTKEEMFIDEDAIVNRFINGLSENNSIDHVVDMIFDIDSEFKNQNLYTGDDYKPFKKFIEYIEKFKIDRPDFAEILEDDEYGWGALHEARPVILELSPEVFEYFHNAMQEWRILDAEKSEAAVVADVLDEYISGFSMDQVIHIYTQNKKERFELPCCKHPLYLPYKHMRLKLLLSDMAKNNGSLVSFCAPTYPQDYDYIQSITEECYTTRDVNGHLIMWTYPENWVDECMKAKGEYIYGFKYSAEDGLKPLSGKEAVTAFMEHGGLGIFPGKRAIAPTEKELNRMRKKIQKRTSK